MSTAATNLDFIAAIFVAIIVAVAVLTLFGMGILMAIGAVFSNRPLVTSWPVDQEHAFSPFEQRGATSNSRAWTLSLVGAVVLSVFAVGVYFGVAPDIKDVTKDMNMSNLTKKRGSAAPAPKPAAAAPAEAPQPDTTAPEAPAEAPQPDTAAPAPAAPAE